MRGRLTVAVSLLVAGSCRSNFSGLDLDGGVCVDAERDGSPLDVPDLPADLAPGSGGLVGSGGKAGAGGRPAGSGGGVGSGGVGSGGAGSGGVGGSGGTLAGGGGVGAGGNGSGGNGSGGNGSGGTPGSGGAQCTSDGAVHWGFAQAYSLAAAPACNLPEPSGITYAALNTTDLKQKAMCGACISITGPQSSTLTAAIIDECPGCAGVGDLKLPASALASLSSTAAAQIQVQWRYVGCPVSGPVAFFFHANSYADSTASWLGVQVRGTRYPVAKVEYESGGTWQPMTWMPSYAYFIAMGGGAGPFTFRITDVHGQVLVESGVVMTPGGTSTGSGQLGLCAG